MKKVDVTISIVSYNTVQELEKCLASIYKHTKKNTFEIIVVDNASGDGTQKMVKKKFSNVILIENKQNVFFSKANNQALSQARGKYFLILNPDTYFEDDSISKMVNFLEKNKNVGACEGLELYENREDIPTGSQKSSLLTDFYELSFIGRLFKNKSKINKFRMGAYSRHDTYIIDVGCDAFFMIRTSILKNVKGYDPYLKLYYTENDLCSKIQNKKWDIYHLGTSYVIHKISSSTNKIGFQAKSKLYYIDLKNYYARHSSYLFSYLLYLLLMFERTFISRKFIIASTIILFLSLFLRIFDLQKRFIFDGEKGDNLLVITDSLTHNTVPLLGPPTSHAWLSFPPLYYYLFAPILVIFNFDPYSYAYFGIVIGILTIISNIYFLRKIIGGTAALFVGLFVALSPIFIEFTLGARFFTMIPMLIPPFLYLFYSIVTGKKKHPFVLGLLLGALLNFHYTPIMLLPFIITIGFFKRKYIQITDIIRFTIGIIVFFIPFLLYDALHSMVMVQDFILWFPYKILGFFGLVRPIKEILINTGSVPISDFFGKSITFENGITGVFLIIFIFTFLAYKIFKKTFNFNYMFFTVWLFFGIFSTVIHKNVPLHYYVPIFAAPIVLFSLEIAEIWKGRKGKILVTGFIVWMFLLNIPYYFYPRVNTATITSRQLVAKTILQDANNRNYTLHRVGVNSQFDKNFAQDYIYLLWYLGNVPVNMSERTYTIYEGVQYFPNIVFKNIRVFRDNSIEVVRR